MAADSEVSTSKRLTEIEQRVVQLLTDCQLDGWDGYGSDGLKVAAVVGALGFHVLPTVNGGIELEWEAGRVSVEFDADGKVCGVMWDRSP